MDASAAAADRVDERLLEAEVLEEGNDVGKGLVEGGDVDVRRTGELVAKSVDEGVGRLVDDDVVGEAGEDGLAGKIRPDVPSFSGEVAEQERPKTWVIEGVRILEGVRKDPQLLAERIGLRSGGSPPVNPTTQSELEAPDRLADHRVHHLLVKARIGLARVESSSNENLRTVEVDRSVVLVVARVEIDDRDVVADGARLQPLIRDLKRHVVVQIATLARIECEHLEWPECGFFGSSRKHLASPRWNKRSIAATKP